MKKPLRSERQNGWNSRWQSIWLRGLGLSLGRFTPSTRSTSRLHRWFIWARGISAQHTRLANHHNPADLTIVHPFSLLQQVRERIVVSAARFFPQIHFAIQSTLNRTEGPRQSQSTFNLLQTQLHFAVTTNRVHPFMPVVSNRTTLLNFASPASILYRTEAGSPETLLGPAYVESRTVLGAKPASQILPDLLVQRLSRTEEHTRRRIEDHVTSRGVEILLQRLVHQGKRVEEARRGSPAFTARRLPQPAESKVLRDTAGSNISLARAHDHKAWDRVNSPPIPPLNIDVITDQVMRQLDSRIIAARERMGKI